MGTDTSTDVDRRDNTIRRDSYLDRYSDGVTGGPEPVRYGRGRTNPQLTLTIREHDSNDAVTQIVHSNGMICIGLLQSRCRESREANPISGRLRVCPRRVSCLADCSPAATPSGRQLFLSESAGSLTSWGKGSGRVIALCGLREMEGPGRGG